MKTLYRKKPALFTAITHEQLVQHGIAQCISEGRQSSIVDGRPWTFSYKCHPISHERNDFYFVPTGGAGALMGPEDMLVVDEKGRIEVCDRVEFEAAHEAVGDELIAIPAVQDGSAFQDPKIESRLRCLEVACSVTPSSAADLIEDAQALLEWVYQDTDPKIDWTEQV